MKDISPLQRLINNDILENPSIKNGGGNLILKEAGSKAKLTEVEISGVPEGSLLISVDKSEQPKTLFAGDKGERMRCDYVLVTKIKEQLSLIFIEMKSKKVSDAEVVKQFKGAECILEYCNAALEYFHEEDDFFEHFKKRFVVLYYLSGNKSTNYVQKERKYLRIPLKNKRKINLNKLVKV